MRNHPRHGRGAERPRREVALESGIAEAAGVADEEHGGEICPGGDEQHADERGRRG